MCAAEAPQDNCNSNKHMQHKGYNLIYEANGAKFEENENT